MCSRILAKNEEKADLETEKKKKNPGNTGKAK